MTFPASDLVRPGNLAVVRSNGIVGEGIRRGTSARWNHVRWITDDLGTVIEANPDGAAWGRIHKGDLLVEVPLADAQRILVPSVARDHLLGKPYGFVDCAALGLANNGITLPSVTRRVARPDRLFCSQLADYGLSLCGFQVFDDGRAFQAVDPGDLEEQAARLGWRMKEWDGDLRTKVA